jgi:hypothetical protein
MSNFYISPKGIGSWRDLLANPANQWKSGDSAYELALYLESAKNLPLCVDRVFINPLISSTQLTLPAKECTLNF